VQYLQLFLFIAAALKKRKHEEQVMEAMKANLPAIGDEGTVLDYHDYYASAQSATDQQEDAEASSKHIKTAEGWDTANGFFYASNETAAVIASGAQNQVAAGTSQGLDPVNAVWTEMGEGGAVNVQAPVLGGKAEYVTGIGNSRWYTGVGTPHEQVKDKILTAAEKGELPANPKGGYWPLPPSAPVSANNSSIAIPSGAMGTPSSRVIENGNSHSSNHHHESQLQSQQPVKSTKTPHQVQSKTGTTILSSSTMQYLSEMAERRKQITTSNQVLKKKPESKTNGGLLGISSYDSDED
jgi:hypothetical protein